MAVAQQMLQCSVAKDAKRASTKVQMHWRSVAVLWPDLTNENSTKFSGWRRYGYGKRVRGK